MSTKPLTDSTIRQRFGWWARFSAIVAPTVAILALLSTCGGIRLLGAQTAADAAQQHQEIETRFDAKLSASLVRIEAAIDRLNSRIDAAIAPKAKNEP